MTKIYTRAVIVKKLRFNPTNQLSCSQKNKYVFMHLRLAHIFIFFRYVILHAYEQGKNEKGSFVAILTDHNEGLFGDACMQCIKFCMQPWTTQTQCKKTKAQ